MYIYIYNSDIKEWLNTESGFPQASIVFNVYEVFNHGSHSIEMGEYTMRNLNGDVWHHGL